ncbi:MAG: ATP-binding cassette domain-containing protein [Ilumatobacteraceae bacterium]
MRLFPQPSRDLAAPAVGSLLLFVVFVGGGLVYQSLLGGAAERLVTIMLIDAIVVLGIQVYVGNTGILSFGHVGFGAIAGYAFALTAIDTTEKTKRIPDAPFGLADVEVSPLLGVAIAIVVTVAIAAVVGVGLARAGAESGAVSATVITLALLFVTHEVARNWPALTGGERAGLSFPIGGSLDSRTPIYLGLLGAILVARLFARSRTGRLAIAAREDNLAARAMGVHPFVQQMSALAVSVALVAVGSSLLVHQNGSILPGDFFFDYTLLTLVMLIVGGRNSVTGAVVGVAVMTAGRELSRRLGQDGFEVFGVGLDGAPLDWVFRENLQTVFLGLSMLVFMIWRPTGLLDDWELDEWLYRRFRRDRTSPPEVAREAVAPADVVLTADGVAVTFGGFRALEDARLRASSGEVVGIIGPNGAGKTTLVNVITGLVPASGGTVTITSPSSTDDLTDAPTHRIARTGLVRTFQNLRLFGSLTVRENVEISTLVAGSHRSGRPVPTVDELVAAAGLWEHRDRRARELDYGNSRRLELARAAGMVPDFLLLDEPTSGMSDTESISMIEQVRGMAGLITTSPSSPASATASTVWIRAG